MILWLLCHWPWFCGCCGDWFLGWPRRDDNYWCRACRRHVLLPPPRRQYLDVHLPAWERTYFAQVGRPCPNAC